MLKFLVAVLSLASFHSASFACVGGESRIVILAGPEGAEETDASVIATYTGVREDRMVRIGAHDRSRYIQNVYTLDAEGKKVSYCLPIKSADIEKLDCDVLINPPTGQLLADVVDLVTPITTHVSNASPRCGFEP